jgi:hypothetical protein
MAQVDQLLIQGIDWAVLALAVWALIDAVIRPAAGYVAASKLNKPAWVAITAVAAICARVFGPGDILWIAAIVAAAVYLVDVRPAVRGLQRGGNNPW